MKRLINFILDILSKKDQYLADLEKREQNFWSAMANLNRLGSDRIYFFSYKDPAVKKAVLAVKANRNRILLKALAACASDLLLEELSDRRVFENFNPAIAVAVPASNKLKGFNHAEEFLKEIVRQANLNVIISKKALVKPKNTSMQHQLSREKRLQNIKGSMLAKSEIVKDKDVIVVDDVITTGATFDEVTRALKASGARRVLCVALAH